MRWTGQKIIMIFYNVYELPTHTLVVYAHAHGIWRLTITNKHNGRTELFSDVNKRVEKRWKMHTK